jgi:hypothetical protein
MLRDELANVSPAWRSVSYAFMISDAAEDRDVTRNHLESLSFSGTRDGAAMTRLGGPSAPVREFKHKTPNSGNLKRTLIKSSETTLT